VSGVVDETVDRDEVFLRGVSLRASKGTHWRMKYTATFIIHALMCTATVHGFVPALQGDCWGKGCWSTRHTTRSCGGISSMPVAKRLGGSTAGGMHMLLDKSEMPSKLEAFNSWLREKEILRDRLVFWPAEPFSTFS
jgi:hypothetical protein